jgi:hypothetical protein
MRYLFKRLSFIFLTTFLYPLFGQEFNHKIDHEYIHGSNLVFDCKRRVWLCVDDTNYEICQKKWKKDLLNRSLYYTCLPELSYQKTQDCIKEQTKLPSNASESLCMDEAERSHFIEFQ